MGKRRGRLWVWGGRAWYRVLGLLERPDHRGGFVGG